MGRRDTTIGLTLAIGLVSVLTPFATFGVDWHHDGLMLKPALDVLSGQVLFRDTFTAYGTLTTYIQVMALWIYPSLLSIKLITVSAYGVSIFFFYAAWRRLLPESLAVLACGMFALSIPTHDYGTFLPWSSVYAMMFQAVALFGLFQAIRGVKTQRWAFVVGIACASAFWCRQPVGIVMAVCIIVIGLALTLTGWVPAGTSISKVAACTGAGFLTICFPVLFGILISGAWPAWWYQNFLWPKKWATVGFGASYWKPCLAYFVDVGLGMILVVTFVAWSLPFAAKKWGAGVTVRKLALYYLMLGLAILWQRENLMEAFSLQRGGWPFLLPLAIITQVFISLREVLKRHKLISTEVLVVAALAGISASSLLQYYPVPDPWHIVWSLAPAYGLVIFMLWRCTGWPASILALVMSVGLFPSVWARIDSIGRVLSIPAVRLAAPLALKNMRVSVEQAAQMEKISSAVDRVLLHDKRIPSTLLGTDPILLCFSPNLENPTPYVITWEGLASEEEEHRRVRYIYNRRPLLFIQRPITYRIDEYLLRADYVSLTKVPELRFEIVAPRESLKLVGSDK